MRYKFFTRPASFSQLPKLRQAATTQRDQQSQSDRSGVFSWHGMNCVVAVEANIQDESFVVCGLEPKALANVVLLGVGSAVAEIAGHASIALSAARFLAAVLRLVLLMG